MSCVWNIAALVCAGLWIGGRICCEFSMELIFVLDIWHEHVGERFKYTMRDVRGMHVSAGVT